MKHDRLIKKIWEERVNQKIDSSLILFGDLKKDFGLKNNQSFLEIVPSEENMRTLCDSLALESSLARARRSKPVSAACLLQIESEISPAVSLNSFIYQFEKAISYFSESEWIEAVHCFLKAKNLAANSLQKATCLINLILCSENLDISYAQSLEELQLLVGNLDSRIRSGIEAQIHSLQLRNMWRNGSELQGEFSALVTQDINQSTYFLTYLDQIPYLTGAASAARLEDFVKKPGHLFNKDFRIRTLSYQWSDEDQNSGRLTDHIERIYLWTWKWIENPQKFPFERLAKAIRNFPWSELDHIDKLSLDNQSQFLLAIGWLAVFDSSIGSFHQMFSKKIKFSINHKFLVAEKNVQMALLQKTADRNPTCGITAAIMNIFGRGIELGHKTHVMTDKTVIDLSNFTIELKNQRLVHSKSLAVAASLVLENENVAIDFFFNKTLSLLEYDQFLNAHQISNMIYKLNKMLGPDLCIRQKNGLIFARGDKSSVLIKNADQRTQILKSSDDWIKIVQNLRREFASVVENKSKNRSRKFVIMLARYSCFSRLEVQTELRLSKTEASRLIQGWLEDELICKKGFGKNTFYKFKNNTKKAS